MEILSVHWKRFGRALHKVISSITILCSEPHGLSTSESDEILELLSDLEGRAAALQAAVGPPTIQ